MRHDPKCPAGYRFLIQFTRINDLDEAQVELAKIFPDAANVAVFVEGCNMPAWNRNGPSRWKRVEHGWRVYVPIKGEAN